MAGSINQFYSDALLYTIADEYSLDEETVTWDATDTGTSTMSAGAVLEVSGGKYVWCTVLNAGSAAGVLVDRRAIQNIETLEDATDYPMVVAKRGSIVNKNYLTLAGTYTSGDLDTAIAALEALGIKVTDKVIGNQPS
jgi:hypothetical protein